MDSAGASCIDCKAGFYSYQGLPECIKCPPDTTSTPGSSYCACPPGHYFSQGHCKACPSDTYSVIGNPTQCKECPPGSQSVPGSHTCNCTGGLFWSNSTCQLCPVNHYSYTGSTNCTQCPGNFTSRPYQGFCECPPGLYWNMEESDCLQCPENHYNTHYNQTSCVSCPTHSTSTLGAIPCNCSAGYKLQNSVLCEICPENTFSTQGSQECTQCPHFKAAAPGSEFCYSCTFGQFWENHTCLQCPAHLYGDGVHCLECPPGFKVDEGFCYRVALNDTYGVLLSWICVLTLVFIAGIVWSNRGKINQMRQSVINKYKQHKGDKREGQGATTVGFQGGKLNLETEPKIRLEEADVPLNGREDPHCQKNDNYEEVDMYQEI